MSDMDRLSEYQIEHFWTHVAKGPDCWEWIGALSRSGKYRVSVVSEGHQYHGGSFTDLDEANRAAIALRNRIFTHNEVDRTERKSA